MSNDITLESLSRTLHDIAGALTGVSLRLEGMEQTPDALHNGTREITAVLPPLVRTLEALEAEELRE